MGFTLKYAGPASEFEYQLGGDEPADLTDRERAFAQAVQPAVLAIVGATPPDTALRIDAEGTATGLMLSVELDGPAELPPPAEQVETARPADTPGVPPDQAQAPGQPPAGVSPEPPAAPPEAPPAA